MNTLLTFPIKVVEKRKVFKCFDYSDACRCKSIFKNSPTCSMYCCLKIMNPLIFSLFPVVGWLKFCFLCVPPGQMNHTEGVNTSDFQQSVEHMPVVMFTIFTPMCVAADAPKILGSVAVYTWEGNPANISCEVKAHPGASVVWFRDGLQLPSANTTNMKIYSTQSTSYLEVCCILMKHKSTEIKKIRRLFLNKPNTARVFGYYQNLCLQQLYLLTR